MNQDLSIVILGGGTAGWMTANLMAARWTNKNINITLVESPDIGIVGVGEGSTPSLQNFFQEIGVEDSEWMPECKATYKNGITFDGWSEIPGYEKYCHPFPSQMDGVTFPKFDLNCQLRKHGYNAPAHPDDFFLGSYLSQNQRTPKANYNFPFDHANGYHFDSSLLGKFLGKKAQERGVDYLQRNVTEVLQDDAGNITELNFKEGGSIKADFFVDCSGFIGYLSQKTLGVKFQSLDKFLFNDRAVVLPIPRKGDELNSQTTSTALKNGWNWDIPLTHRSGNGYVFSSRYCTDDEAETELRTHLGMLDSDVEARFVKWKQGMVEKHWYKNCLSVGLSQGFIEPLEAMALHLIYTTVGHFITDFETGNYSTQNQETFNKKITSAFEAVADYLVAHYRMNSRTDSQYWIDNAKNPNVSVAVADIVNAWMSASAQDLEKAVMRYGTDLYFPPISWQILFAGYGVFPDPSQLRPVPEGTKQSDMQEVETFIARCASNFKAHHEGVAAIA